MIIKTVKTAESIAGTLSSPGKMPCYGYGIDPEACITGSKLRKIEGSVCHKCYAFRGNYCYSCTKLAFQRRMKNIGTTEWVEAMVFLINHREKSGYFRWHDSGDLQSFSHLVGIVQIAERLPHIKFWLPTKEHKIVQEYMDIFGTIPDNLIIRMSSAMVDSSVVDSGITGNVSLVEHKNKLKGYHCPAYKQGGKCKNCRSCWLKNIQTIIYPKH